MMPQRGSGGPRHHGPGRGEARRRPRVVILEDTTGAQVEILQLPASTTTGACFEHHGIRWRVTGTRTREMVFIATPELQ